MTMKGLFARNGMLGTGGLGALAMALVLAALPTGAIAKEHGHGRSGGSSAEGTMQRGGGWNGGGRSQWDGGGGGGRRQWDGGGSGGRGHWNGGSGGDGGGEVLTEADVKLEKPKLYKVLLHNDDFTTMDFVVFVLQYVFMRDEAESISIMLKVHNDGIGLAGIYPYEIANMKAEKAINLAKAREYPFLCTVEEE